MHDVSRQLTLRCLQDDDQDLPQAVKECEKSVRESNPDMDRSTVIAVCRDMHNKGQLTAPDPDDPDREAAAGVRVHRGLAVAPGAVRRVEHDDGSVTYRNMAILAPGEWTDAASGETIFYAPEAIQRLADAPEEYVLDAAINVNHEHQDQLAQVGRYDPASLATDDDGVLYADATFHRRTSASEDVVELIDLALESDGERGAGGPSVEIPREGEQTAYDRERGMQRMEEFSLGGLAIVTDAASEDVAFEEQFADRAVAMAGDADAVRVMQASDTLLAAGRPDDAMSQQRLDEIEARQKELASSVEKVADELDKLEVLNERLDEMLDTDDEEDDPDADADADGDGDATADGADPDDPDGGSDPGDGRGLQDFGVVEDVIQQASEAGFDLAQSAAELLAFAQEELGVDEEALAALQEAAEAYLQSADADSLEETPAEDMLAFVADQAGGGDDEEEGEDAEMAKLREQKRELESTVEEMAERVEALEDQPRPPRVGAGGGDDDPAEEEPPAPAAGRVQRRGDYISQ